MSTGSLPLTYFNKYANGALHIAVSIAGVGTPVHASPIPARAYK
jgi:hypothetical protein